MICQCQFLLVLVLGIALIVHAANGQTACRAEVVLYKSFICAYPVSMVIFTLHLSSWWEGLFGLAVFWKGPSSGHQLISTPPGKMIAHIISSILLTLFSEFVHFAVHFVQAGLIDGVALKCLHSALEETTTTLLSNQQLDAAKTNRVLQVQQFEITAEDLGYLVKGALFGSTFEQAIPRVKTVREDLIKGILRFWDMDQDTIDGVLQGIQANPLWKRTYHLRDLLWLLFYLKHHRFEQNLLQDNFKEASFILTKGVLRNFGGLQPSETRKIVEWAFQRLSESLSESCPKMTAQDFRSRLGKGSLSILDALLESLEDCIEPEEDLNHTWFRYIMVIDTTGSNAGLAMLLEAFQGKFRLAQHEANIEDQDLVCTP